jgi:hypothetical protein
MKRIKLFYDFFRLWIYYGERKEAWEDANTINDEEFQREMKEIEKDFEQRMKKYGRE